MGRAHFLLPSNHDIILEKPRTLHDDRYADSILFAGNDSKGNKLVLYLFRKSTIIQTNIYLQIDSDAEYHKSDTNSRETNDWFTISAKLECCEPMKIWRLVYNGAIRGMESKEIHHLKMNLLWHSISSPVYLDRNRRLTFTSHKRLLMKNDAVFKLHKGYEQWGTLHGFLRIDGQKSYEVNMSGLKKRFWSSGTKNFVSLISFSNILSSSFSTSSNLRTGHVRSLKKHAIVTDCDLKYPRKIPEKISFEYLAENNLNVMHIEVHHPPLANFTNLQIFRIESDYAVNGEETILEGFLFSFKKLTKKTSIHIPKIFPTFVIDQEFILELSDSICWGPESVGREASFLSKIKYFFSNISNDESVNSIVRFPKSIFLTSNAMDLYLQSKDNVSLRDRMEMLKLGFFEAPNSMSRISLQEEWENSMINKELFEILLWKIDPHRKYTIQSSAVCESIYDVRAAGQYCIHPDVEGVLCVIHAIKRCWASVYSLEALKYRRDHGIPLVVKIGVIIQEMVNVDLFGVIHTCHPKSRDPRIVSIDVNSRSPNFFQEEVLALENPLIFTKQGIKIQFVNTGPLINLRCDSSTDSSSDSDDLLTEIPVHSLDRKLRLKSRKRSIRKQFSRIAEICVMFENIFSQTITVEWGFVDNKIYIFQCIPVTDMFAWSDFEICHELDSGFTEFDAVTFHAYGEMSCDVTSPLSITFVQKIMEEAFNHNHACIRNAYHKKRLAITQFHTSINVCNTILLHVFPKIPFFQSLVEMATCGQVITTEELYKLAQKNNGISRWRSIFCAMVHIFKLLTQCNRLVSRTEKLAREFKIDAKKYPCVESLFDVIIEKAECLLKITNYHFKVSNVSLLLECVTLWLMTVGEEKNWQKHLINLSLKLENVNTMSSELPSLLKEIASLIEKYDQEKEYLNMSPTQKLQFHENFPTIQSKIQSLMRTFGFHCMKEMDLMSETWSMNFTPILENIDSLIMRHHEAGSATPIETTSLVCSHRYGKIVNLLTTRTKNALLNRERTKKSLLSVLHQFRLAFLQLGSLLAQDVRIPSANLVFYFTLSELRQIIENDGEESILHKGYRRYQLWNKIESLQYDDIIVGLPKCRIADASHSSACVLEGIAVSYHCTIGKANVIFSREDVKRVSPRDIIVTRNIDAGWSLYFHIITGLVTETGGLMSREAIAARECGLPCIVGVKNVTSYIETGDIISINGIDGIVSKLL